MNACQTWQWTNINGVNGYKIVGPNGNSIFLPAVGFYYGENGLEEIGIGGGYWCNSLNLSSRGTCGDVIYIETNNTIWMSYATRCFGRTIRAVRTTTDNTALIESTVNTQSGVEKVFQNGTIYVVKPNGEKYTIDGQRVE